MVLRAVFPSFPFLSLPSQGSCRQSIIINQGSTPMKKCWHQALGSSISLSVQHIHTLSDSQKYFHPANNTATHTYMKKTALPPTLLLLQMLIFKGSQPASQARE